MDLRQKNQLGWTDSDSRRVHAVENQAKMKPLASQEFSARRSLIGMHRLKLGDVCFRENRSSAVGT